MYDLVMPAINSAVKGTLNTFQLKTKEHANHQPSLSLEELQEAESEQKHKDYAKNFHNFLKLKCILIQNCFTQNLMIHK